MPPANSSLNGQFHVETRGTAFSIYQMCIYVGTVACSCAAGWLASLGEGGWRKAFVLFDVIWFSLGAMAGVMFGGRFADRFYARLRAVRIEMTCGKR